MELLKNRKASFFLFVYLVLFVLLYAYDTLYGQGDGLLKGLRFQRIFFVGGVFSLLIFLLASGVKSDHKAVQNLSLSFSSFLLSLLFIEFLSFAAIKTGLIKSDSPAHHLFNAADGLTLHRPPFWGDYNEHFAKWRLPHDTLHIVNCEE